MKPQHVIEFAQYKLHYYSQVLENLDAEFNRARIKYESGFFAKFFNLKYEEGFATGIRRGGYLCYKQDMENMLAKAKYFSKMGYETMTISKDWQNQFYNYCEKHNIPY